MKHDMKLYTQYLDMIKDNQKTIEYRLNDEKRQKIKVGDTIVFHDFDNELDVIEVVITKLEKYEDLLSMYTATFGKELSRLYKNPMEVVIDTTFYTDEEINRYGCLAIYFSKK